MDIKEALVQVLSIIAIIVVGGFLVFFLGDLMLAILDPDNTRSARKKREQAEKLERENSYNREVRAIESQPQPKLIEEKYDVREVDELKALEQQKALNSELESHFEKLREEEEAFRKERMQFAAEKQELLKKLEEKEKIEEPVKVEPKVEDEINYEDIFFNDDEDDDDFNLDDLDFSDETETTGIIANDYPEKEVETHTEDTVDEDESDDLFKALFEDNEELEPENEEFEEIVEENEETDQEDEETEMEREYIEQLKRELQEQKDEVVRIREELAKEREEVERVRAEIETEKQKLAEQLQAKHEEPKNALSLEEYEARLTILKERLVANNKEYKLNKKEYLPLRKVKKSLDNDKNKLRRKEALVAKQKVMLYGVNNYVDIDEEKAKKLAEDLDLLDGLRLSVQHCEEVMKNNSERYPILERTYEILKENNENLKADIEEVEKAIASLKEEGKKE